LLLFKFNHGEVRCNSIDVRRKLRGGPKLCHPRVTERWHLVPWKGHRLRKGAAVSNFRRCCVKLLPPEILP
jgi:hypothetical protein